MHLSTFFSVSTLPAVLLAASLFASTTHAQDRTTEQGEAQISDPNVECTAYYYAPVGAARYNYPPVWTIATILSNDTAAQAKYNNISSGIPNIAPKGTQPQSETGNFTGFNYSSSDPDCWWTYHQCTTPKYPGLQPDTAGVPEPGTLGYGFDDGPNCSHNAFYDYLSQQNQKATMFYIGSNVMDWPLEAQRGLADGHEICVHTWSHKYMTSLTNEEAFAEFYYSTSTFMQAIQLVVGVTPTCWRPPFGDVDDRIRWIANALGLRTIIWQYDSNDWKVGTDNITTATVDANYQALIQRMQNGTFATSGTIMLTHELNNYTMSEAISFYPQLKAAFKALVPIGVALNITQPYVQPSPILPNFEQYVSGTETLTGSAPGATGSQGTSSGSSTSSQSGAAKSKLATALTMDGAGGLVGAAMFVGGLLRTMM
ncbi:carbohydrate esterase family 4 protein [Pisolithus microcarpus 441]|uniref:chitin deacetylase n=1 Tax=Pisolithus microcarpus 441 TaxID=765257 RepID=A0A0D0A5D1_9AGAM|nr:carbohydrate esterase family 4 protein [Pisolithus microcarpus]KIK29582.1 carbohydrate esterase family 4 protein [Pisolithus microcarpus 441]